MVMELVVREIPEEGLELRCDAADTKWFQQVLSDALGGIRKTGDKGDLNLFLLRTGENVDCRGELAFDSHPVCARCLKEYRSHLTLPIHFVMAPLYENDQQMRQEMEAEVEITADDLEFSYYRGDRINLGEMIREQIILELPIQPVCKEECKGLCPHCGQNWNEGDCSCKEAEPVASAWEALKAFRPRK